MLILTRKKDQKIYVGEGENQIEITVTEVMRSSVRLGIRAPKGMLILRGELVNKKEKEDGGAA